MTSTRPVLSNVVPVPAVMQQTAPVPPNSSVQPSLATVVPARTTGPPAEGRLSSDNLPDPGSIERQKKAYARSLDAQLEEGSRVIAEQNRARKEALMKVASEYKQKYLQAVDQQLRAQEMELDKKMNMQFLHLNQTAFEQKMQLEQQVSSLKMEYGQRKAQEDFAQRHMELQKQRYDAQMQIHKDVAALVPPTGQATSGPVQAPIQGIAGSPPGFS